MLLKSFHIGRVVAALLIFSAPVLAQVGVSNDTILIGQSAGFTGGQAEYSKDVKAGLEAAFAAANRNGGVNGRQIKLVTEDDGGKKEAVLANTKKLNETHKVLALIGYTSGAGTETSLDYITKSQIPILSPATGNMGIRASHNPYLFHTRAGYNQEMSKIISNLASLGYKRFALAYLGDVGPANLKAMQDALASNSLSAVAVVTLDRNAQDFTPQVDQLIDSKPEMVIFISNAKPIVKIVQGMRARGFAGQFATSSFAGSRVVGDLEKHARGLVMIQVLPQPQKNHLKFHQEFHADLQRVAPNLKPNYTVLEGYIAARVMVEGLKRAGKDIDRTKLVAALESISNLNLGGYYINFSNTNHDGSKFVDMGVVDLSGRLRF